MRDHIRKDTSMAKRQGVREVRLVFETEAGNFARTDDYIVDRITWGLRQVNNAIIGFAVFDEQGRRICKVEFREASLEMKKVMEAELGTEEVVA
jgi:hypothetical protein